MKRNILKIMGVALATSMLFTGCGEKVLIENGEVAKQLTTSGLEKGISSSGAIRLDACWTSACPKLVRLAVAENSILVPGKFFIKKSDLEMELEIALQYGVKRDEASINSVFDRVKGIQDPANKRQLIIEEEKVFNTFVKPILRDSVRIALNNYSIDEIIANLAEVRTYVESEVRKSLKESPIKIVNLTFSKVSYPESVMKAKEDFAKINLEKATKIRAMAAELEIMAEELKLKKARAKMAVEVDEIISKRMNPNLEKYMILDAINKSAENGTPWAITGDVVFRDLKK
jgi:hypothetical protein